MIYDAIHDESSVFENTLTKIDVARWERVVEIDFINHRYAYSTFPCIRCHYHQRRSILGILFESYFINRRLVCVKLLLPESIINRTSASRRAAAYLVAVCRWKSDFAEVLRAHGIPID